jgi:hypothetical protein
VSKSIHAIYRLQLSNGTIAATLTVATRRAKPSPFAVARGAKVQAIASPIFIWRAAPAPHRNEPPAPSYSDLWRRLSRVRPTTLMVAMKPLPYRDRIAHSRNEI